MPFPGLDAAAPEELRLAVARVRRRRAWVLWVDGVLGFLFVAYFALACLILVDRIRSAAERTEAVSRAETVIFSLLGATVLGAAWAAARLWLRRPGDVEIAHATDRRFGLGDRFSTALDMVNRLRRGELAGRAADFARAQVADAARFVRSQDLRQVCTMKPLGHRWTSAVALLIALWLAAVPPDLPRGDDSRDFPEETASSATAPKERMKPRSRRPKRDPPQPTAGAAGLAQVKQPAARPEPKPEPQDGSGGGGGGGGSGRPEGKQESPEQLFGEPERTPVKLRPEEVQPLEGEGPRHWEEARIYAGEGAGEERAKAAPVDLPALFEKYRRVAEETLDREKIPPGDRDFVRRYFEGIRPKETSSGGK